MLSIYVNACNACVPLLFAGAGLVRLRGEFMQTNSGTGRVTMSKDDKCGAPKRSSKGKNSSWSGLGDGGEMPSMQTIPKTKCYHLAVPVVQQQGLAAQGTAAAAAAAGRAGVAATRQLVVAQAAPVTVSTSIGSIAVAAGGLATATVSSSSLTLDHVAAPGTAASEAAVQPEQQQQHLMRVMELREVPCNIRAAFVAAPGWVILDADYNQIELRVMAHASQDGQLMAAFGLQCGDVFRALGAKWLKKPEAEVGDWLYIGWVAVIYGCGRDWLYSSRTWYALRWLPPVWLL
jgi:hypothetical protein